MLKYSIIESRMKRLWIFFLFFFLFSSISTPAFAIEDPTTVPNNKVGVHILFPSEIDAAAKLVNANGGDWGYVTIPIQSGDKDLKKWQQFMDSAKQLHVIPIIRLATEGDYFNTKVWRKPSLADVLDFANFLNSLTWPVRNRYVIVYNEVNRGDEWGGVESPIEYANILSYAVTVFKSRNNDFFIISAGMDNAAATTQEAMNEYAFLQQMNTFVPGIFNQVDGMGSHSYPNPGFLQPPTLNTRESISSFVYESTLIDSMTSKQLPIFITETGWSRDSLSDTIIAGYMNAAFTNTWINPRIIAVTPFLLEAGVGPFQQFSLLSPNGTDTPVSLAIEDLTKQKGTPFINPSVLGAATSLPSGSLPTKWFTKAQVSPFVSFFLPWTKAIGKRLLGL